MYGLVKRALFLLPPEQAHALGMSALRLLGAVRSAPALPRRWPGPVGDQRRPALRPPGGARRRVRQGRRGGGGVLRGGLRRRGGGDRDPAPAAREPGAAAVPHPGGTGAHQPDGLQQPRGGRDGRPAPGARPPRRPGGREPRKEQGHAARARGGRLRRRGGAARRARRLRGGERELAQHPRAPHAPGAGAAPRAALDGPCTARGGRRRASRCSSRSPRTSRPEEVDAIVDVALEVGIAGLICTNTTLTRAGRHRTDRRRGGRTLRRSAAPRWRCRRSAGPRPGRGAGWRSGRRAASSPPTTCWSAFEAGADLVQIYTAFVYEGPFFVPRLLAGLRARLQARGIGALSAVHSVSDPARVRRPR